MHCVNHPGVEAQSFCQNCGKALCSNCIKTTANGQILCEPCFTATGGDPSRAYWQAAAQNFVVPPPGSPNPGAAAVLGLIPGVGAMYNGQLFKGLIHVVVFAVLVSITDHYMIFLIFVFAWCLYQSFEAFQTAKAKRDGLPLPDPFGLNELGGWLNWGNMGRDAGVHPSQPPSVAAPPASGPGTIPGAPSPWDPVAAPPASGAWVPSGTVEPPPPVYGAPYAGAWGSGYQPPPAYPPAGYPSTQPPFTEPYAGQPYASVDPAGNPVGNPVGSPDPYAGGFASGVIPPMPPMPPSPFGTRGKEPIWAIILIGLGVIFLLHTMGFVGHFMHYLWPLMLIGLGVWLFVHRAGYTRGGSK